MEIFWETISQYNSQTWISQCLIVILGIFVVNLQLFRPSKISEITLKLYLFFLYIWIAIVYYLYYCEARNYNTVMAVYWMVMAMVWIWEIIKDYTIFKPVKKYRLLAFTLMELPFIYPLISIIRGMEFPGIVSPLMPNSVATFTIGLLLLYSKRVNIFTVLLLCHWSLIGLTKTFFFNIPEDYILVAATIPALYVFFKQYLKQHLNVDSKPSSRLTVYILLAIFVSMATVLSLQYYFTH